MNLAEAVPTRSKLLEAKEWATVIASLAQALRPIPLDPTRHGQIRKHLIDDVREESDALLPR